MNLTALAFAAWTAVQMPVAPKEAITLDQALNIARKNAFAVRTAESAARKTHQQVLEAKGNALPKVTVGGTYSRYLARTSSFGGTAGQIDSKQLTAGLSFPIDITGLIGKGIKITRLYEKSAAANIDTETNSLKNSVRNAYFNLLRAHWQVDVETDALKSAQDRLKIAQLKFDQGKLARFDVLRLETQVTQAQTSLISAEKSVSEGKNLLNSAMAQPIESPVDVMSIEDLPPTPNEIEPETLVGTGYQKRPEITAADARLEAYKLLVDVARSGNLPSLNFSVLHAYNPSPSAFGQKNQTTGTLQLSWPIYDSGVTHAKIKEAEEDQEQAKITVEQIKLAVSLQVRQAVLGLKLAKENLALANKQLEQDKESLRIANLLFENGKGILLDITTAQENYTRALAGVSTAKYNYLTAYAELERAVGTDELGLNEEKK